jgi:von Willebrand factor type A domain
VVEDLVREFEARFPWLSSWFGDRLDIELPAFLVSLTVHGLLLIGLAFAGYRVHKEVRGNEFKSEGVDNLVMSESTFQDLDQSDNPPSPEAAAGSFTPTLATTITSTPSSTGGIPVSTASADTTHGTAPELVKLDVRRATEVVVPTATMLGQTVSIRGNGAEMVGGVEGAVDRIAIEIVRRLEQGRTLVVWAFDASGSLQAERQRLGKHIETIYAHINQLDESHLSSDNGLLTMVVAFGQNHRAQFPKPTADRAEILEAIKSVTLDESGIETTFATVADIVHHWGHYKDSHNQNYRTMVIVVTDEVGDDENRLEDAIALAQKAKVPIYVLGSQAIFGRKEGHMDYVDPKTKRLYRNLEVRQGPESVALEQIKLPFWYGGSQYEIVEAGFGPFALSRLAASTGGIYFITRFDTRRMGFDPARMREYKPDWVRRDEYDKEVSRSLLRQAVLTAAQITQQKLPGMPALSFPAADGPEFKEAMANNQAVAERTAYTVDEALGPINAVLKLRDREKSRRWQANYDLIRGRLLATKVRCYEYNWACALMKKDPPKFSKAKSNAWRLVPDQEIRYSDKAAAAGREAEALLHRIVEDHPATPWALLAQRELENPLGFKWMETYVSPRPRTNDVEAAKRKNKSMNQPKPPEVPKL